MVDRWRDTSVDRQASRSDVVDRMVEMRMEEEMEEPSSARLLSEGVIVLCQEARLQHKKMCF